MLSFIVAISVFVGCVAGQGSIYALSQSDKDQTVADHNYWRNALGIADYPQVEWNQTLADFAAPSASMCVLKHTDELFNGTSPYGENIYTYYTSTNDYNPTDLLKDAVAAWATELANVDPQWKCIVSGFYPGTPTCGHYSQMIWKSTVQIGCAVSYCSSTADVYVYCEYDPRGNSYKVYWNDDGTFTVVADPPY